MAKFQWRAADGTLGAAPSGLTFSSVGGGSPSDWEIVAAGGTPPTNAGGQAVRLKSGSSATSYWLIPGADTTGRVDVRMLFYRATSNVGSMRVLAGYREDIAGAGVRTYYGEGSSTSQFRLNAFIPAFTGVVNAGTQSSLTGWFWVRYTYDPEGTTKHRIRFWRADGSEEAPLRSAVSNTLLPEVDGVSVGFGAPSSIASTHQVAWITVGTGGDDADAEPNTDFPLTVAALSRETFPASIALPDPAIAVSSLVRTITPASVALPSIKIHDDFERCSIDLSLSSVSTDTDDVPLVSLQARRQTSTIGTMRWLEPVAKLTGVLGLQPRIEINPFQSTAGDYRNHQTWWTQQRAHYSYDGENWIPISSKLVASTRLTWRHNAPFEQDTVYVARSWPRSLTQIGAQVAAVAAAHPTKISPAPSAAGYTPTNPHGFPAAAFICDELSAKTDELGRAVPVTPIYGFVIDDQAYATKRKTAVITMGIHAGEDVGEVVGWEQINYLLGDSASAQALRANTRILVYPCVNPAGRFAGYWRGAPGSDVDTNREWNVTTPTNDCVTKAKAAILSDVASLGNPVAWGFDIHASPGAGGRLQLGINIYRPATVEFDSLVRAKYPAGLWGDYGDRNEVPDAPELQHTITGFQRRDLAAKLVMLNETADALGPISPAIMQPYAAAQVDALADMDAAGWFDEAPTGTLTLGAPSVTSSSISLPWTYSAADHDGIEYRYRLTAGAWSAWIDAGLVSPIDITGLTSGAEYEIEARAYNPAGAGTPQTVTVTVGAGVTLMGAAAAQGNSSTTGAIGSQGSLSGASTTQTASATSGQVSSTHILVAAAVAADAQASASAVGQGHLPSRQVASSTAGAIDLTFAHNLSGSATNQTAQTQSGKAQQTHVVGGAGTSSVASSSISGVTQGHVIFGSVTSQSATSTVGATSADQALQGSAATQTSSTTVGSILQEYVLGGATTTSNAVASIGVITQQHMLLGVAVIQGASSTSGATYTGVQPYSISLNRVIAVRRDGLMGRVHRVSG